MIGMKRIYVLFFALVSTIIGQSNIRFDFDYAQFQYDSTSNYLEIYYSIIPSDFTLSNKNDEYFVQGKMHIQIQQKETNELVVNKNWGLNKNFKDTLEYKNGQSLLGVVGFTLKKGDYVLNISVEDVLNTNKTKSYSEDINILAYSRDAIAVSGLEFASRIITESKNENSIFYKNTLEVYPNPSIIYTNKSPVLFYYSELYNLDLSNSDKIELKKTIINKDNIKIYETSKAITSLKESIVEVGIVNLKKYPTDSYKFILSLYDSVANKNYSSSKKFYLVNPDVPKIATNSKISNYMASEFGVLTEDECDDLFSKSKIIASGNEIDQYDQMDSLASKREYLFKFWGRRDETPSTNLNEFKRMFMGRVNLANERYKTFSSAGYKTDRGRIYTRLGEPDEIERFPNETNSKPYEIWNFHQIEGGVYFIFGDYTGFGNYELLHSTMRGELQDPSWANRLSTK